MKRLKSVEKIQAELKTFSDKFVVI